MAKELILVFNTSTDVSIVRDEEGHVIEPQTWAPADKKVVKDDLKSGLLIEIDEENVKDHHESSQAAIIAKQELHKLKDKEEAEEEKEDKAKAKEDDGEDEGESSPKSRSSSSSTKAKRSGSSTNR